MIIKIENAEQEKYILAQAEKEGFTIWGNIRLNKPFNYPVWFNWSGKVSIQQLSLWSLSHDPEDKTHTFQDFKQSREESNEDKLINQAVSNEKELIGIIEKLQAENEELKDRLEGIEIFINRPIHSVDERIDSKIKDFVSIIISEFFQTPTQKKALEIIEANEKEVIEEVVRVFKK